MVIGRITVYYRSAGEHLDPNYHGPNSSSSSSGIDLGHAFLRIDDYRGGDTDYLDGWAQKDGSFYWLDKETQNRLDDHHDITWLVESALAESGMREIQGIKNSSTRYGLLDYNCAGLTARVLRDIGYPIETGTIPIPGELGGEIEACLDDLGQPFDQDVSFPPWIDMQNGSAVNAPAIDTGST